jgi:hypothetical protein
VARTIAPPSPTSRLHLPRPIAITARSVASAERIEASGAVVSSTTPNGSASIATVQK